MRINKELLDIMACPECKADLIEKGQKLACSNCKREFEIEEDIPKLISDQE